MEVITDSIEKADFGAIVELAQVSVVDDAGVSVVNGLLGEGWRLLHIGHLSDRTVYVLGKPAERSRRSTGFVMGVKEVAV